MNITIHCEGENIHTTLDAFLNENADGFDDKEVTEIRSALTRGEKYQGGGGAGPEWTVCAS